MESMNIDYVEQVGFIVNPKWPWLGASPDGIISSKKTIEIKCPYSKRNESILEACSDKSFFLEIVNGAPKLKRKHNYYFQCQGVMAITETYEIDFVVYTVNDLHIETIQFNSEQWEQNLLPELTRFYFDFLKDNMIFL